MNQLESVYVIISWDSDKKQWFTNNDLVPPDSRIGENEIIQAMSKQGWPLVSYGQYPHLVGNPLIAVFQRRTDKKVKPVNPTTAKAKATSQEAKPMLKPAIEQVQKDLEEQLEKLIEEASRWDQDIHHFASSLHKAVDNIEFITALNEQIGLANYLERTGKRIFFYQQGDKNYTTDFFFGQGNFDENISAWIEIAHPGTSDHFTGFSYKDYGKNYLVATDTNLQNQWDHGWSHDIIAEIAKLSRVDIVKKILGEI